MRKPNGYGSVIKLSGARRNPYAVRIHTGYTDKGTSTYKYIGYYPSRKEAEMSLANYNTNPYILNDVTFEALYEQYKATDMKSLAQNTQKSKQTAFNSMKSLYKIKFAELRPMQVQECIDKVSTGTQPFCKSLFINLEQFAIKNEYTSRSFGETLIVAKRERKNDKKIFSEEHIDDLWNRAEVDVVKDALILIYTGLRISEYLELTKDSIKDGCITGGGKTEAGKNRIIPIHPRIMPLIEEKLCMSHSGALCKYDNPLALRYQWQKEMTLQGYSFHECRHTFRSRLDNLDANETCIDLLMGHKGNTVGKSVYTHKTLEQLKNTIELLR